MLTDSAKRETLRHGFMVYPKASVEGHSRAKAMATSREDDIVFEVEDVEAIGITEEYLKKIMEELVDNAVKFSDAGRPIQVTGGPKGDYYEICIRDQGRGLTPEQIANIGAYMQFERRLYEQQGSGLGLVICKRLVDLHGGDLTIDSVEGQGTTVCVRVPLRAGILTGN
jgi:signal transduction histidine kinase